MVSFLAEKYTFCVECWEGFIHICYSPEGLQNCEWQQKAVNALHFAHKRSDPSTKQHQYSLGMGRVGRQHSGEDDDGDAGDVAERAAHHEGLSGAWRCVAAVTVIHLWLLFLGAIAGDGGSAQETLDETRKGTRLHSRGVRFPTPLSQKKPASCSTASISHGGKPSLRSRSRLRKSPPVKATNTMTAEKTGSRPSQQDRAEGGVGGTSRSPARGDPKNHAV